MLLFQSIIVYILFAFLLYKNANKVTYNQVALCLNSRNSFALPRGYIICILIFVIISGLRYDVGVDYFSYLYNYNQSLDGTLQVRSRGIEYGFLFVMKSFSSLGFHPVLYFSFLAFIQSFFVIQAMKDERDVMPFMLAVMVLGTFYISWMNGIRQMIVACSFIWATKYILEKNLKMYLLWIVMAYMWHRSCVLLIIPFLFAYIRFPWNRRLINIGIFLLCFILGRTPYWTSFMLKFEGLIHLLGYDIYANQLYDLVAAENFNSLSFGPRMFVVFISYILVIIFYPKVRMMYDNQAKIDLFFKLFFIGACGYYLFVNTNIEFLRPIQYFDIFALPMIAYTLVYLRRINSVWFYMLFFVSMSFTLLQCYNDINLPEAMRRSTLFQFYPIFQ